MEEILSEMDIESFVKSHVPSSSLNARGNTQKHFGPAGGQNVGKHDSDEETLSSFGTTKPRNNKGTEDPRVKRICELAADVGKLMQVDLCQDDFLSGKGSIYSEHIKFAQESYGSKKARFPSFSLAILPLREGSRVNRHRDQENCLNLTSTLIISVIIFMDGTWYRVSLIFYSRKSISDFVIRRRAMSEVTGKVDRWLQETEPYQLPWHDTRNFAMSAVGCLGFPVIVDVKTFKVVGLGLRSKPLMDKQGTFLSPIVCALANLMREKEVQFSTELFELLSIVTYLNNLFVASVALNMMQSCWDRSQSVHMPSGLVQYTLSLVKRITGCITGGPGRRCQTFVTRPLPFRYIRANAKLYRDICYSWHSRRRSGGEGWNPSSNTQMRKNFQTLVVSLARAVHYGAVFSVSHVVWCMCLLGILPSYLLDYAVMSTRVTQNKPNSTRVMRASRSPHMDIYLKAGASHGVEGRSGKLETILKSICSYLCALLGNVVTLANAENAVCEASRASIVEDIIMPGYSLFRRASLVPDHQRNPPNERWYCATPWITGGIEYDYASTLPPPVEKIQMVYSSLFDAEDSAIGGYIPLRG